MARNNNTDALLQRGLTLTTQKHDVPVFVSQFICHDGSLGSFIGRNHKELVWRVVFDRDKDPVHIKLTVQEHKLHHNEVGVESNGQQLLGDTSSPLTDMKQDFSYRWPFRANIIGLNVANHFQVRPAYHLDVWHPATITKQNENGTFEVDAMEPNEQGGLRSVHYPAVESSNLREAASHKPLKVPQNSLTLYVPCKNPTSSQLTLEDSSPVTHHFGRLSPAPSSDSRHLIFKVAKDRKTMTANIGHAELTHFVSGEVRIITNDADRSSRSWRFQLGPFAEHTVEVSRKSRTGGVITLLVDGEIFVEATAADIGCDGSSWELDFDFVGERVIQFEVYKTNTDGDATDEIGTVVERRPYSHKCSIVISNSSDFRTAQFRIDNWAFHEHEIVPPKRDDPNVVMSPDACLRTYNIAVPYKVDPSAPTNLTVLAAGFSDAWKDLLKNFSCFACCSKQDPADKLEISSASPLPPVKSRDRYTNHEELEQHLDAPFAAKGAKR